MEFLVRRFRADIYLKTEMIMIFIPFHEIHAYKFIVEAVQFDDLDSSKFPCSRENM